ncbi:MAG TPA: DNA translocase FtsK 4TM domain-containing protein [Caulobacteraceae bacterium]|jgi:S-DNA-T family DNA segregation ATPase FtsK/SpoIIIE
MARGGRRRRDLKAWKRMFKELWTPILRARLAGLSAVALGVGLLSVLASYHASDPSFDSAGPGPTVNLLGPIGADLADIGFQSLGVGAWAGALLLIIVGGARMFDGAPPRPAARHFVRVLLAAVGVLGLAGAASAPPPPAAWPLAAGLGGMMGDGLMSLVSQPLDAGGAPAPGVIAACLLAVTSLGAMTLSLFLGRVQALARLRIPVVARPAPAAAAPRVALDDPETEAFEDDEDEDDEAVEVGENGAAIKPPKFVAKPSQREARETQPALPFDGGYRLPELAMLRKSKPRAATIDEALLRSNAQMLENVLAEFGVRGQIDHIRPGPVVTLYELVPAAGVKSARVVALADDIARSMSVEACRVSVVPGRNAIGIELPNAERATVYLRDLLSSPEYEKAGQVLPLALGETIGGEPYVVDLAKMPHLLIAGTTGSGKSVGVNAMILSILYRLTAEEVRFIMIDPKMLELSAYDGIPHLLAPVVTDPKRAIIALKWTVREMEDRYRRMSKIGVRNVAGYNERAREAMSRKEHFVRTIQTGFDERGRPIFEEEKIRPDPMPYLVVVIDEVADLMMVAGKDIEGAVQRLAQMARAAGIHLIMATQRPSVDVITGTIKANFPTRISFQVTSKIDSRTIMGEQGAEQLLGMGDMLYMAGGGRITRLHGPFVSDAEVDTVARFLRSQGKPDYVPDVTAMAEEDEDEGFAGAGGDGEGADLYDQAVAIVARDRKASTSYIQRRLQIGYNRAASLIERMEKEGVVSVANHAGKREVLVSPAP